MGVNRAWIALVVVWGVLYFAGLALLPRQIRRERELAERSGKPGQTEMSSMSATS